MAMVSPSCTVTCVLNVRCENESDWMPVLPGATGLLTFSSICIVTTPLELMRGTMESVTPELTFVMVLVNRLVPPVCTPATACEVSTGTCWPTFIVAGMLSVAMMLGDEIRRDCELVSAAARAADDFVAVEHQRPHRKVQSAAAAGRRRTAGGERAGKSFPALPDTRSRRRKRRRSSPLRRSWRRSGPGAAARRSAPAGP